MDEYEIDYDKCQDVDFNEWLNNIMWDKSTNDILESYHWGVIEMIEWWEIDYGDLIEEYNNLIQW